MSPLRRERRYLSPFEATNAFDHCSFTSDMSRQKSSVCETLLFLCPNSIKANQLKTTPYVKLIIIE